MCTSDSGYVISSQSLTKDQNSNSVTVTVAMSPVPPPSATPSLTSLQDALSLNSFSWNRGTVTMKLNLLRALNSNELLNVRFSQISATTTIPTVDSNNAELRPYD